MSLPGLLLPVSRTTCSCARSGGQVRKQVHKQALRSFFASTVSFRDVVAPGSSPGQQDVLNDTFKTIGEITRLTAEEEAGDASSFSAPLASAEPAAPEAAASTPSPSDPTAHPSSSPSSPTSSFAAMFGNRLSPQDVPTTGYAHFAPPPRNDPLLSFMTNLIMKSGKKARAEHYLGSALAEIRLRTNSDPLPLVRRAVEMASPLVRMTTLRTGAKSIPTPSPLTDRQRTRQAITWILEASNKRNEGRFHVRLAQELIAVVNGASSVLAKKEEVHRMAFNNRANASVRV